MLRFEFFEKLLDANSSRHSKHSDVISFAASLGSNEISQTKIRKILCLLILLTEEMQGCQLFISLHIIKSNIVSLISITRIKSHDAVGLKAIVFNKLR